MSRHELLKLWSMPFNNTWPTWIKSVNQWPIGRRWHCDSPITLNKKPSDRHYRKNPKHLSTLTDFSIDWLKSFKWVTMTFDRHHQQQLLCWNIKIRKNWASGVYHWHVEIENVPLAQVTDHWLPAPVLSSLAFSFLETRRWRRTTAAHALWISNSYRRVVVDMVVVARTMARPADVQVRQPAGCFRLCFRPFATCFRDGYSNWPTQLEVSSCFIEHACQDWQILCSLFSVVLDNISTFLFWIWFELWQ